MNNYLSKSDIRKLLLLHTIEGNSQQKMTILDLKERMNISEFIFLNTYEELKQDIQSYDLTKQLHIQKSNQTIKLQRSSDFSIETLRNIYVKNSLGFNLIRDIFEENIISSMDYTKILYTSRTKFYMKIGELKKNLEKFNIKLTSGFKLIGDEVVIRIYISQLYASIYGRIDYPFSSYLKQNVLKFIRNIEKKTNIVLSLTSQIKLLYFLSICQIRIENKKNIKRLSTIDSYVINCYLEKIIKDSYQYSFSENISNNELRLLLYFIESLDEFSFNMELTDPDPLTTFFMAEFQNYFGKLNDIAIKKNLMMGLMNIHYPVLLFKVQQTELDTFIQTRFIKENYPEVLEFYAHLRTKIFRNKRLSLIKQNEMYLSNRYIFLLINTLPVSFFSFPIKISIDFKLGKDYNQFIYRNIQTFDFINIEVNQRLTNDTDILLCDYLLNDINEELNTIVWTSPPTPGDWSNFGTCISKIRTEKYKKRRVAHEE